MLLLAILKFLDKCSLQFSQGPYISSLGPDVKAFIDFDFPGCTRDILVNSLFDYQEGSSNFPVCGHLSKAQMNARMNFE